MAEKRTDLAGLRRLALQDLDEPLVRELAASGEHLFVEGKRQLPKFGKSAEARDAQADFAAHVASFANALGGFILIGVNNKGELVGLSADELRHDLQSSIGDLLHNHVDPLPPYVAGHFEVGDATLGVIRVFESSDTPHVVRSTGAIPVRDDSGKKPVSDYRSLRDLATRGEANYKRAEGLIASLRSVVKDIGIPILNPVHGEWEPADYQSCRWVIGVTPLTVTPHFSEWAISKEAAETVQVTAIKLNEGDGASVSVQPLEPRQRGVFATTTRALEPSQTVRVATDSAGVIAATRIRQESSEGA